MPSDEILKVEWQQRPQPGPTATMVPFPSQIPVIPQMEFDTRTVHVTPFCEVRIVGPASVPYGPPPAIIVSRTDATKSRRLRAPDHSCFHTTPSGEDHTDPYSPTAINLPLP